MRELATRLSARHPSLSIEVACLSKWGPIADELRDAGVRVTAFNAAGSFSLVRVVTRLVQLIGERNIDTVFSFLLHANAVAALASRRCRSTRFLQSIQTTQPDPRWHWKVQAFAHHAADRIVVPSPSAATAATEWSNIPRRKIDIIPNALDIGSFQPSPVAANPRSPFSIGFIGRLDPVKRVPLLIEQFSKLQIDARLSIYGDGRERAAIRSAIGRSGVADRIALHAKMGNTREALSKIAMLVLPSEAEGFGLVLIEAMAARVPVVACRVAGVRDVVEHGRTGLLARTDGSDLSVMMTEIISDRPLRERLIESAHKEVARRYDWSRVIAMYDEL